LVRHFCMWPHLPADCSRTVRDFSLPPTSLLPSIPHSTRPSPPLPPSHPPTPSAPSHPFRPQVRETSQEMGRLPHRVRLVVQKFAEQEQKRPYLLLVVQRLDHQAHLASLPERRGTG